MENKSILDKIQKLMAVAECKGATDAEAQSAALMAQKLMAKHGIEMSQLNTAKATTDEIVDVNLAGTKAKCERDRHLAHIIADNFKVGLYINNSIKAGKKVSTLNFMGRKSDVETAIAVYNSLRGFIERRRDQLWWDAKKAGKETKNIAMNYDRGFFQGLRKSFEKQVTETALVLVKPDAVVKALDLMVNKKIKSISKDFDPNAFNSGYEDAANFGKGKQIEA